METIQYSGKIDIGQCYDMYTALEHNKFKNYEINVQAEEISVIGRNEKANKTDLGDLAQKEIQTAHISSEPKKIPLLGKISMMYPTLTNIISVVKKEKGYTVMVLGGKEKEITKSIKKILDIN